MALPVPTDRLPAVYTSEAPRCLNCASALRGRYCSDCGQAAGSPDPSVRELVTEVVEEFLHWDGKLVLTLKRLLLARPGALTVDVLSGQRARYVSALRLYLTCTLVYFLVGTLSPHEGGTGFQLGKEAGASMAAARHRAPAAPVQARRDSVALQDSAARPARESSALAKRLRAGASKAAANQALFQERVIGTLPNVMLFLVPLFALGLMMAQSPPRRRFPAHLCVALHFSTASVLMLLAAVTVGIFTSRAVAAALEGTAVVAGTAYMVVGMQTVYGGTVLRALRRVLILTLLMLLATFPAMGVAVLYVLATWA